MIKKWQYYNENNQLEAEKIEKKYNLNSLISIILANRGIKIEDTEIFLNPTRHDFHNPFDMPDMEKAVERILKAIKNKEKTIIFGDYDVDGITSISVLKQFLNDRGLEVGTYIPNRLNEGYGLNKNAIKKIAEEQYTLMITVDCGITAVEEIEFAKQFGIETIVTDHHEPSTKLPQCVAVVDCKREDNSYSFRELAGVGVAFKLTQAISKKMNLSENESLKYLDIVAVGTISDIVPLVDENRTITKLGLKLIKCTKNIGLKTIISQIGFNKIDSTAISFGIAPRINACGRMGNANLALDLLLCKDIKEANEKVSLLEKYNYKRQAEEKKIFEDANNQIVNNNFLKDDILIIKGKNWHTGVIGIVSSKITELYYKPSILIGFDNECKIGRGSGRSIEGFNLHDVLLKCENDLIGFGGHSMAIGISIEENNFEKFKLNVLQITKDYNISKLEPIIKIDKILALEEVNKNVVESISQLEPFGEGNRMPIFGIKNLKIDSIRALSEGKHLKLTLKNMKNNYINAIGFNMGDLVQEYKIGDKIDIAGNIEINSYNGIETIQINLKDIKKSIN